MEKEISVGECVAPLTLMIMNNHTKSIHQTETQASLQLLERPFFFIYDMHVNKWWRVGRRASL